MYLACVLKVLTSELRKLETIKCIFCPFTIHNNDTKNKRCLKNIHNNNVRIHRLNISFGKERHGLQHTGGAPSQSPDVRHLSVDPPTR